MTGLRAVDLTQPLSEATPPWPDGGAALAATVTETHATTGCYARRIALDEHIGTHFDAPAHFADGGATVEAVPVERLVVPAVVVDVRAACAADPDHAVTAAELVDHEDRHGRLPAGCAVLLHTGWDAHRGDPARYVGDLRFPGLAPDAGRLLVERRVAGVGIDTLGIDPGAAVGFPTHRVTLPAGLWHLEGLVNLAALPAVGATLVVGVVPLAGGSGAPARVIALVP